MTRALQAEAMFQLIKLSWIKIPKLGCQIFSALKMWKAQFQPFTETTLIFIWAKIMVFVSVVMRQVSCCESISSYRSSVCWDNVPQLPLTVLTLFIKVLAPRMFSPVNPSCWFFSDCRDNWGGRGAMFWHWYQSNFFFFKLEFYVFFFTCLSY